MQLWSPCLLRVVICASRSYPWHCSIIRPRIQAAEQTRVAPRRGPLCTRNVFTLSDSSNSGAIETRDGPQVRDAGKNGKHRGTRYLAPQHWTSFLLRLRGLLLLYSIVIEVVETVWSCLELPG